MGWLGSLPVAVVAAAVVGGVAASSPDPRDMVLQLSDLPGGFMVDAGGTTGYVSAEARAKADGYPVAKLQRVASELKRDGYVIGYEADYKDKGSTILGIAYHVFVLKSVAVLFKDDATAKKALDLQVKVCRKPAVRKRILRRIGEDSLLCSVQKLQSHIYVQAYALAWRSGRVVGYVELIGLAGSFPASEAVTLGERQQRRIAAATR